MQPEDGGKGWGCRGGPNECVGAQGAGAGREDLRSGDLEQQRLWSKGETGVGTGGVNGENGHLGNLGFGDSSQACIQLQVLTTSQQLEDGIRLRAVAHAAVSCGRFLGHAGDGEWGTGNSGHWLALAMRGASRGRGAHPP